MDSSHKAANNSHDGEGAKEGHPFDSGVLPGEPPIPQLSHRRMIRGDQMRPFADVAPLVLGGAKAFAHSFMIHYRADGMLSAKDKQNLEKKKKGGKHATEMLKIELQAPKIPPHHHPKLLMCLLDYIYQGFVRLSPLQQEEVFFLAVISRQFKIERLTYICELYLRETLSLSNVSSLLRLSHDMQSASVKSFCLAFAIRNYTQFISSKEVASVLGLDLFQEVVTSGASGAAPKDDRPPVPPNRYLEDMKALHDEMLFCDAHAKVGTERIRFHKAVLAAHSEPLAEHLKKVQGEEVPFPLGPEGFKAMLRFIYYGYRDVDPIPATELITFTREFNLQDLQKACEGRIQTNVAVDTVVDILNVTYLAHMETRPDIMELRASSINFLIDHLSAVELTPLRKMPAVIALDVLMALQAREKGVKVESVLTPVSPKRQNSQMSPRGQKMATSPRPGDKDKEPLSPKAKKADDEKKKKEEKEQKEREEKERKEKEKKDKKKDEKKDKPSGKDLKKTDSAAAVTKSS